MRFYDENNNIVIISNHCTAIKIYELSKTLLDFHCLTLNNYLDFHVYDRFSEQVGEK